MEEQKDIVSTAIAEKAEQKTELAKKKETLSNTLLAEFEKVEEWLPEDIRKEKGRLVFDFISMLNEHPEFKNYNTNDLKLGFMKGASLGLNFYTKDCYLIPYGSRLNFQTDYKGEIKVVKRYSQRPILDIYAKVVREGEQFESGVKENGDSYVIHKANEFGNGKVVGAYAVVKFIDGGTKYDAMSVEELEAVREAFSKSKNSPAWKNTPYEMYKKEVLRRLCKTLTVNFVNKEQITAWEDGGDADFSKVKAPQEKTQVIDVSADAVEVKEV